MMKKLVGRICNCFACFTDRFIAPAAPKAATVEPEEDLPDVNEENVDSFSQEVRNDDWPLAAHRLLTYDT